MKTKMIYIADDGREFDNMKKCEDYEKEIMSIKKTAKDLQDYCISRRCSNCIFDKSDGCMLEVPCDWELDESGD